ncbi:ABC transporter permease [Streptomyces sp. NBC_00285]|uniref:ABC transporter permease n=1 Tax=Streptomyces sp. NBC_00285 TaxID=2975700 RepID=UPI002E286544|nr:ABC transporter permease [Streptomyces sp. NBC_00285]
MSGSAIGSTAASAAERTTTTPAGRVGALGRAELTLFLRSKGMILSAVFLPLVLPFSLRASIPDADLKEQGLSLGMLLIPGAVGFSLLFAVYTALTGVFVGRREELVLKRLRTGELRDHEIMAGAALPAIVTSLVQCVLLAVGCSVLLDLAAPKAPLLAVLGVLLGLLMSAALAALTASFTRTVESAQVTGLPLMIITMMGSGVAVPREFLPDRIASVCELLPLTPVITLVRGGWSGDLSAYEALGAVLTALAWTALTVFAVQRWFRWEPRR